MKKTVSPFTIFWNLSLVMLASFIVTQAQPALADTKIGIINDEMLMLKSKAAESVQSQFVEKKKALQSEVSGVEKTLGAERDKLKKEAASLSKEELKKKALDFEKKVSSEKRRMEGKSFDLERSIAESTRTIKEEVERIVAQIAKDEGFTLVITGANVVYADGAMDITPKVMEALNKSLPTVKLTTPPAKKK